MSSACARMPEKENAKHHAHLRSLVQGFVAAATGLGPGGTAAPRDAEQALSCASSHRLRSRPPP